MAKPSQVRIIQGDHKAGQSARVAVVVARFNEYITQRLLDGCLDELTTCGVAAKNITVVWVPGAYEIPLAAQKIAKRKSMDAIICLGAVVKGQTKHYDLVAEGSERGIMQVMLSTGKPVIFEILAADTMALVEARARVKGDNKGRDAARAAVEMIDIGKKIEEGSGRKKPV